MFENPIDCECPVFFLNRYLKFKLNLTCNTPEVYKNRKFADMNREDPSERCEYKKIADTCHTTSHPSIFNSEWFMHIVIVVSVLAFMFTLCCCASCVQTSRLNRVQKQLNDLNGRKLRSLLPVRVYVDSSRKSDTQKLVES